MTVIDRIDNLNLSYKYQANISITNTTWFGVGGLIDIVFKTADKDELSGFLKSIPQDIAVLPIGVTSNLLIDDEGFRGIFIKPRFLEMKLIDSNIIEVGASVLDVNLAKFAAENGLGGLEFLNTIPGTIGGAVAMNAGCFGSEIADILISATGIDRFTGEIKEFPNKEIGFSYRYNSIKNIIWISAKLFGIKSSKEEIYNKMERFYKERSSSQPKSCKTGGSTFCNPTSYKAWQLIDEVGLRGYRIGGAYFSDKHCNFIINDQSAKAQDIKELILLAEQRVKERFNIALKREIIFI